MIAIYCRRHHTHGTRQLCPECSGLLDYALKRLDRCPKGNAKSSCRKCEIHCYAPAQRQLMREAMRYVGPRMIFIHPVAAIRHLYHELK